MVRDAEVFGKEGVGEELDMELKEGWNGVGRGI
jgi:hypothetical protein